MAGKISWLTDNEIYDMNKGVGYELMSHLPRIEKVDPFTYERVKEIIKRCDLGKELDKIVEDIPTWLFELLLINFYTIHQNQHINASEIGYIMANTLQSGHNDKINIAINLYIKNFDDSIKSAEAWIISGVFVLLNKNKELVFKIIPKLLLYINLKSTLLIGCAVRCQSDCDEIYSII